MVDPGTRVTPDGTLLAPGSARGLLAGIDACSAWRVREVLDAEVVHEIPGRRRTLRFRVVAANGETAAREVTWYAKQYSGSKGARVWRVLCHLQAWPARDFALGEPIGYLPEPKLLVVGALEGPTLADALESPGPIDTALERTGRALASVHEAPCPWDEWPLKNHGPREEVGVLEDARRRASASGLPGAWIAEFLESCPAVEKELTQAEDSSRRRTLLHRDLHPGQIVLLDEAIGLLDWDEASSGEPELDLGNLEAHLLLDDFQKRGTLGDAPRRIAALRTGYRSRGDVIPGRLATYTRSALLRLATLERLADPRISVLDWAALARALTEAASHIRPGRRP